MSTQPSASPTSATPIMTQAAASTPVIDLTHRRPTRAGTTPTPAPDRNAFLGLASKRSHTLSNFPVFDPYVLADSAASTPKPSDGVPAHDAAGLSEGSPQPTMPVRFKALLDRMGSEALNLVVKHWIVVAVFFIFTIVGVSIGVGWSLRLSSFQAVQVLDLYVEESPVFVTLSANLISVDSDDQSMTLDWFVSYFCAPNSAPGSNACPDVNIYFDQNLLRTGSTGATSNSLPPPIFSINATDYLAYNNSQQPDYRPSSLVFRTAVAITNFYTGGRTAQAYPFDKYTATLVFFAESTSDNSTVPLGLLTTKGIAVGFNAKLDTQESGDTTDGVSVKNLTVTRGQVIRMYALLIVIAIWMITMTFIMACIVTVFFGKGVRADILVLPVATLFAFTQLRSTMPGAPNGFGADIDFVGILPCLALLTFSSIFMSAVFMFRDPEDDSPRWLKRRALSTKSVPNSAVPTLV